MEIPEPDEHATASFRRFYALLPRSADAALVILKLHLLVEEQIRAFLAERVKAPALLKAAHLDCFQAICLAEALCEANIHPQVWEAAKKLNNLRNEVAHKLEPKGATERIVEICTLLGLQPNLAENTRPEGTQGVVDDLSFAVSVMYSEISLYVRRKPAEVLRLVTSANTTL